MVWYYGDYVTAVCLIQIRHLFLACYFGYLRYIEERSFRRFVEACLEETVIVYVDHLLIQVFYFTFKS